jgi:hypothetical protein
MKKIIVYNVLNQRLNNFIMIFKFKIKYKTFTKFNQKGNIQRE